MGRFDDIKVIAFDADDTLWDNEPFFRSAEADMLGMISKYVPEKTAAESLYRTEVKNMPDYGYGAVAFTMSMIENAVTVTGGKITADEILRIVERGRKLLRLDASPLDGVKETLGKIRATGRYRMMLFTKGELLTQMNKLKRSGLSGFFDRVAVLCDKKEKDYLDLCEAEGVKPENLLMVGNSLKSDMYPALSAGAYGVHIPYEIMWDYEKIEPFTHERMVTAGSFSDLVQILNIS